MARPERQFWLTNLDTTEVKQISVADSDEIEERHFRSMDYNSVLRSDTVAVKFPRSGGRAFDRGGYYFILDAKELLGTKARVQLTIKRRNPHTNNYEDSFTGMLEFNPSGGFTQEVEYISVKIIDSRKLAKFKERDEIDYNVFDLVSSDNITVLDFTNPYIEATYKTIDVYLKAISSGHIPVSADTFSKTSYGEWAYQGDMDENEIGSRVEINGSEEFIIYTNDLDQESTIQNTLIDCNILISTSFSITADAVINGKLSFVYESYTEADVLVDEVSTVVVDEDYSVKYLGAALEGFQILISTTDISLPSIDIESSGYLKFSLRLEVSEVSGGTIIFDITARTSILDPTNTVSRFQFYEKTSGWEDNQIRGMYPHELATRLIQLTTSETDTSKLLISTILGRTDSEFHSYASDGLLAREFATNGYQLRQFVDRALNINFKDFFKSLSAISPIGLWYDKVNDYFVIEDIEEFYKSELFPISLGQAKNLKTTYFKQLFFNTILTGYPKTDNEDYSGVNEPNTQTEHEISIEDKAKRDYRSPYLGASVDQELLRRKNITNYASLDTKNDKNVYITTLNSSDETVQGDLSSLEGFLGIEQYYNLTKTPRQNLIRQSPLLLSPLYKDTGEIITFRKSAKDTNISYINPGRGDSVNEFDNIIQYTLRARLIDPELDEFEGLYTEEIANEIVSDPHRVFQYTDIDGENRYGYIWDVTGNRIKGTAKYSLIKCNPNRIP